MTGFCASLALCLLSLVFGWADGFWEGIGLGLAFGLIGFVVQSIRDALATRVTLHVANDRREREP